MVNKAYLYVTLPIFSVKNGTALAQATRHLHPEVEKRILVPTSIAMMVCLQLALKLSNPGLLAIIMMI